MRTASQNGVVAATLVAVTGALAWVSGVPFIFPSLGPTAYLLAVSPDAPSAAPRRVIGGHAVGVLSGLTAVTLFSPDVAVTADLTPLSAAGFRIAVSGVLATGLTAGGMLLTDLEHAPVCATTLIVSLGLLPTVPEVLAILGAVVVLVTANAAGRTVLWDGSQPTNS